MSNNRTASMLARVPKILAVTANSYGLSLDPADKRPHAPRARRRDDDKPVAAASRKERATH